jgi:hypothetical protein
MRALTPEEMLAVWERGWRRRPFEQALALLAAACPDESPPALAALSLAERDLRLMQLRTLIFGPELTARADCAACSAPLELRWRVNEPVGDAPPSPERLTVQHGEFRIVGRPPTTADLAVIAGAPEDASKELARRCVAEAYQRGEPCGAESLPESALAALEDAISGCDPSGDFELTLTCAACGESWRQRLDIVAYLWAEIDACAQRLLLEVNALASRYGWSETEILSLSPWRREIYLQMARQ